MKGNPEENHPTEQASDAKEQVDIHGGNAGAPSPPLTFQEKKNLFFAFFAWACTVCNVTLVVGTSAVIMVSIGGSPDIVSAPLGLFMLGASSVSLLITPWIFSRYVRKVGFLVGSFFGCIGAALGAVSITQESPAINITANYFFGVSIGIGFFLRFAAVEVVPVHFSANAMSLVVAGGVVAAFAGPVAAQGTRDMFEDHIYLGIFLMSGIFAIGNALFVSLVDFPPPVPATAPDRTRLTAMWRSRDFVVPALISSMSWACMMLPMSMVRIAMHDVGFSARQSLTVMEWHFVGMYAPGFAVGRMIRYLGHPLWSCLVACTTMVVGLIILWVWTPTADDGSSAVWLVGLFWVGVAWNIGFTASSMWTASRVYRPDEAKVYRAAVQSGNDVIMFALAGAWVVSASYIYELREDPMDGYSLVCQVCLAILAGGLTLLAWYYSVHDWNGSAGGGAKGDDTEKNAPNGDKEKSDLDGEEVEA